MRGKETTTRRKEVTKGNKRKVGEEAIGDKRR